MYSQMIALIPALKKVARRNYQIMGLTQTRVFIIGVLFGIAFDSRLKADVFYAVDKGIDALIQIEPVTGKATEIGFLGYTNVNALTFDWSLNTLWGVDAINNELLAIDRSTGEATSVGSIGFGVQGLTYDINNDILYGIVSAGDFLISINRQTAAGTVIGPVGFDGFGALAFDQQTNQLYAVTGHTLGTNTDHLIRIDPSSGEGVEVGSTGIDTIAAMTFANNQLYAVDFWSGNLVTLDTLNGTNTLVGHTGYYQLEGLAYVPEPSATVIVYCAVTLSLTTPRRRIC